MGKPAQASDMKTPSDKVFEAPPLPNSQAALIAAGTLGQERFNAAAPDPLKAIGIIQDTQLPSANRGIPHKGTGMVMSGVAAAPAIAIGARVYHRKKHGEGKVIDISAMGKIDVEFDDGSVTRCKLENLVKL